MTTVITYGTFDIIHRGHINILDSASRLGDQLIVGLSTDEFNASKGKRALMSFEDRKRILESIRYVDRVIPEANWEQKIDDVESHSVDIFAMGSDWAGRFDYLDDYCEVRYLPRTEGISSSAIKRLNADLSSSHIHALQDAVETMQSILRNFDMPESDS